LYAFLEWSGLDVLKVAVSGGGFGAGAEGFESGFQPSGHLPYELLGGMRELAFGERVKAEGEDEGGLGADGQKRDGDGVLIVGRHLPVFGVVEVGIVGVEHVERQEIFLAGRRHGVIEGEKAAGEAAEEAVEALAERIGVRPGPEGLPEIAEKLQGEEPAGIGLDESLRPEDDPLRGSFRNKKQVFKERRKPGVVQGAEESRVAIPLGCPGHFQASCAS
jgi:hypothetical protein